jgi:catechol 2,3-dioxygenase-like lactoylglutathione lyase family enzyme
MKRLHVHVSVNDLAQSIRFYSTLFATEPTVVKPDYAKWMLEDPRVNFAISISGGDHTGNVDIGDRAARRIAGISHLGIQAEDETELAEVYDRLAQAERPIVEAKNATCCYAKSDKQWIADPQGVPWETFFTYGESTVYGEGSLGKLREANETAAPCCVPSAAELMPTAETAAACCVPEPIRHPEPAATACRVR